MAVQAAAAIGVTLAMGGREIGFHGPWLAITLAVLAARLIVDRLLVASLRGRFLSERLDVLAGVFSAGLLVSAALWAYLACARFPIESQSGRYVVIVVLSALAGGATGVLAPLKMTGRLYITLILLPASLTMILASQEDGVLGVLGVIFWLVMLAGHRNNHALLVDAIRLRDENRDLLRDIARRSHDLDCLNRELEHRVALRTRELEEARGRATAANEAKSRFLGAVSHEMRTPLNAILGLGQVLARAPLPASAQDQVTEIKSAARRLRQMVDDIVDLSRLQDGSLDIDPQPFRPATLAWLLDDIYRPVAEAKKLRLTVLLEAGADETRLGDIARLRQIAGELIENALKFTREGGIDCRILCEADRLRIEVADTGEGVPPEKLAIIFEQFAQANDSSTREAGGLGVGLALCRALARHMDGEIRVESALGAGSTFTLVAPCPRVAPAAIEGSASVSSPSDSRSLLVVDDNAINRRIVAALVEPFGVECGFAADGREALEAWRARRWDAIFMDVHMPVMDGVQAARLIRAEEEERGEGRVPIVAVTASLLEEEMEGYRAAGMDEILPKPIEVSALADTLGRCLGPLPV
ncbi:ATP-binding protein [uncultured Caulobacter sp.]|uniref:ATP-binding protein n=1 Tax=uncultured Caulobacter sp. TaxID=158749 RepID=UPI00262C0FAD|nr:ATP-binding protein [uncultured Caulobacter sp.]